MIPTALTIAGILAIVLATHSVMTMGRRSIWPTLFLFGIGSALIFEGVTIGIVRFVVGR